MVDEKQSLAEIWEECTSRGLAELHTASRLRGGGALKTAYTKGNFCCMRAVISTETTIFGQDLHGIGGQALKKVGVHGDDVHTTWVWKSKVGYRMTVCLSQAHGVHKCIFPSEDDLLFVGDTGQMTLVTSKLKKVIIGVDDTDAWEMGDTCDLSLRVGLKADEKIDGVTLLDHRTIQLNPAVGEKTSDCVSSALIFAVDEKKRTKYHESVCERLVDFVNDGISKGVYSDNALVAVWSGIELPKDLVAYGKAAKSKVLGVDSALNLAKKCGVRLIKITGERGLVGALAAIGLSDSAI